MSSREVDTELKVHYTEPVHLAPAPCGLAHVGTREQAPLEHRFVPAKLCSGGVGGGRRKEVCAAANRPRDAVGLDVGHSELATRDIIAGPAHHP